MSRHESDRLVLDQRTPGLALLRVMGANSKTRALKADA
jgi:hypothetical protein